MQTFISESEISKALDYIRDNAMAAAKARAEREYITQWRKTVKAQQMKLCHDKMPIAQKEAEAYASDRYIQTLDALRQAIENDEKHRFMMQAAQIKIDAWRTQESSLKAAGRLAS